MQESKRENNYPPIADYALISDCHCAALVSRSGSIDWSLPEWIGEIRNWDYRFSWVRDSVFTVHALYELGCEREAKRFLQFIQPSSAVPPVAPASCRSCTASTAGGG